MATTIRNRSFTAAALALAAGVCGIGASQAKGDIDWSISLNLGYSSNCGSYWGGGYGGWGYSGWGCRPYYPRPCYTPYYSPWCGSYYTGGYYISAPVYAFSTPLYMPSGSTFVYSSYSPWGSGFTYTTTTYYTPYSNYYAPAYAWNFWPSTGITINFWDDDHDDHHHHRRNRHDWDHVDHHDRSANFPRSSYSSNLNGKPNTNVSAPAAQTYGTAGPTGYGLPESKGPRSVTPVAAKPIESKPIESKPINSGKPSLDSLTQNRPSSFNGKPVTGPVGPSKFPQTSTGKPVVQAPDAKPAATFPSGKPQFNDSKPIVQAPVSKPSIPTQTAPNKAPVYQSDKGGEIATAPQQPQIWSKPATSSSPAAKPSTGRTPSRSTAGMSMPTSRNGMSTPSAMPAPQTISPSKPSVSTPAPSSRMSAPSPSPRASAPVSSPKAPSGPSMPSGGNKMGGGSGGHGKGR